MAKICPSLMNHLPPDSQMVGAPFTASRIKKSSDPRNLRELAALPGTKRRSEMVEGSDSRPSVLERRGNRRVVQDFSRRFPSAVSLYHCTSVCLMFKSTSFSIKYVFFLKILIVNGKPMHN